MLDFFFLKGAFTYFLREKSNLNEAEAPVYSAHLLCFAFTKREINALERKDDDLS